MSRPLRSVELHQDGCEPTLGLHIEIEHEHATLGVGPPDALGTELFAQGSVFGLQVLDDGLLVAVDPSGDGEKEELEVEIHRGGDQSQRLRTGQVLGERKRRCGRSSPLLCRDEVRAR